MCREGMCFRGMRESKYNWDMERREGVLELYLDYIPGTDKYVLRVTNLKVIPNPYFKFPRR